MGDIIRNGCLQHLTQTRAGVTYTLDQVWTHDEPYKSTYVQKNRQNRYFYGHVERLMSKVMDNGCSQYSTQLCTSVKSSLDQVRTDNEP